MNEKFSGFNTSVKEFFQQYEDIAALNNWSDATKLIVMPMYLSGPAYYFYKTKKISSTTYEDMRFFFQIEFGEPDYRPVQTGPPPIEQTAEPQKTDQPLVESKYENPDDDDEAEVCTIEPKTDQAPVGCALEHNEKHHDEAPINTSASELSSHIKEEKIDPQDENKETKPQDENLLENKNEEKTSLSSVTADSKSENYSDSEKSEKSKEKSETLLISNNPARNNENIKNENLEAKIPLWTYKSNNRLTKKMKKVHLLQRKPQAPKLKEARYKNSSERLRRNIKMHFKVKPKMESSPKESSDRICNSHAEGKVVEGPTATGIKSQAKFREIVVKKAFPFDRGRRH